MAHHILLVEDNDMLQEILSTRLEMRGFRVTVVSDGNMAVEYALSLKPDLILMDMSLPYLNGWEATKLIRANEETKHTPIIGLTARALVTDKQRGLDAGCNDYLTKPVAFKELISKIHAFIGTTPIEN
jgi:two-component system cell cycle response regulator DivK